MGLTRRTAQANKAVETLPAAIRGKVTTAIHTKTFIAGRRRCGPLALRGAPCLRASILRLASLSLLLIGIVNRLPLPDRLNRIDNITGAGMATFSFDLGRARLIGRRASKQGRVTQGQACLNRLVRRVDRTFQFVIKTSEKTLLLRSACVTLWRGLRLACRLSAFKHRVFVAAAGNRFFHYRLLVKIIHCNDSTEIIEHI